MAKRILITGGGGFIAHHLINQVLLRTDWEIVTLDRLDYSGNLNRLHDLLQVRTPAERKRVRTIFHDLKAEIKALKEMGYDGTVSLELFNESWWQLDPKETLRIGLQRMHQLFEN